MRRLAQIFIGILFAAIADGFVALALFSRIGSRPIATVCLFLGLAVFSALVSLAYLVPASRPVTERLAAGMVFAATSWGVLHGLNAVRAGAGSPSIGLEYTAIVFLTVGVPAAFVTFRGRSRS